MSGDHCRNAVRVSDLIPYPVKRGVGGPTDRIMCCSLVGGPFSGIGW
jgi:hypothetical protein